ncbi:hypothetical protein QFZ65_003234 [Arthrobacter sp. B3I9]|uniref:hypothetical protein n=1 Tax=Arthrobacter sp. B3I9 TaxID=3042270 RepID=UPI002794BB38|nr:hypothetical protein [Arthrobacter sp. B3I9]MDQ0851296.1 hypothetical protein [Arthrobacter sp. B3I9]
MTLHNALRVVRLSALYDLVVTAGFAFVATATVIFDMLGALHQNLGLTGLTPDPHDPFTVMFANLMGSVVTVWALFRIFRPSLSAAAADVGARVLFSLGMSAALVQGASPLVLVMLILEIAWALAQSIALLAARRARTSSGSPADTVPAIAAAS